MSKKILTTPIAPEDLADIKIGDVIYLTMMMTILKMNMRINILTFKYNKCYNITKLYLKKGG